MIKSYAETDIKAFWACPIILDYLQLFRKFCPQLLIVLSQFVINIEFCNNCWKYETLFLVPCSCYAEYPLTFLHWSEDIQLPSPKTLPPEWLGVFAWILSTVNKTSLGTLGRLKFKTCDIECSRLTHFTWLQHSI